MNNLDNDLPLNQEVDFDAMEQIFKTRMRLKKLSQISFELRTIENTLRGDTYDFFNATRTLEMYQLIESKILEVAEDIKNNR